jgi:ribosomal protein S20
MPVTKTAKRALRGSAQKGAINAKIISSLEAALRTARKTKKEADIQMVQRLADRAVKKKTIHKNKASRITARLSSLSKKAVASKKSK